MTLLRLLDRLVRSPLMPLVMLLMALALHVAGVASHVPLFLGAISVTDFTSARRQYFNSIPVDGDGAAYQTAYAFFSWLAQMGGKPDLQVVPFTYLTGTDKVIADAPCKAYLIILKKNTTTTAYFKLSDHATTSSSTAPELEFKQSTVTTDQFFFPKGSPMANGITISSDTTSDGNTGSSAGDGAAGVIVLGRP